MARHTVLLAVAGGIAGIAIVLAAAYAQRDTGPETEPVTVEIGDSGTGSTR